MPVSVKDIMSSPVITIEYHKNVRDAGELMKKTRRGALIAVDNGKPVGIITDSDLVKRIVATGKSSETVKVNDIMSKPLVTIGPNEDVLSAVRKMKKINVHRLPVVDEKKVVGMISLSDVAKTSPEMLDLLEYREEMKGEEPLMKDETTSGICESCEDYSEKLTNVNGQWICSGCAEDIEGK